MLKLGEKSIKSLFYGDKAISKAYLGDKLVFKTKNYTEVEYLESTGTQYIDTDVYSKDINYIEVEAQYTKINARQALLGCYTSQAWNTFGATNVTSVYQNFFIQWINAGDYGGSVVCDTNKHLFVFDKKSKKFSVDGSIHVLEEIYDVNDTLYMFSSHSGSTIDRQAFARIYRVKLKNNDTLVRDFIPVLDENNVACMYDKVTKQFFYNKGTGQFLYNKPYTELAYIESTGTQYIDTGIKLTNNHSIYLDYQLTQQKQTRTGLFGGVVTSGNNQARFGSLLSPSNSYLEHGYGAGNVYWQQGMPDTNRHIIYQIKNELYFDDVLIHTFEKASFSLPNNTLLGNFDFTNYKPALARYYACKLWNGDVLVRDFIPVLDNNNVPCLYDKVTNEFFYNQGTGQFLYGVKL